jgi:hypothetical protein
VTIGSVDVSIAIVFVVTLGTTGSVALLLVSIEGVASDSTPEFDGGTEFSVVDCPSTGLFSNDASKTASVETELLGRLAGATSEGRTGGTIGVVGATSVGGVSCANAHGTT